MDFTDEELDACWWAVFEQKDRVMQTNLPIHYFLDTKLAYAAKMDALLSKLDGMRQ